MKTLINDVITETYNHFIDELVEREQLCLLKDFRYNEMTIPDYTDSFVQNIYLLRYFPAYLVEYYDIYKDFLKLFDDGHPFRVLSIGCGCAVDYCGLELALRDINTSCSEKVYYTGIDIVKWELINDFNNPDFSVIISDIMEFDDIRDIQGKTPHVIIFPKSIGEFSDKHFQKLLKLFKKSTFKRKTLYFISSIRKQHIEIDQTRMRLLLELMESEHRYQCDKDKNTYTYYKQNVGLRKYFYEFIYPQNIYDYLDNLKNQCPTKIKNGCYCEADCEEKLNNKRPIMKTDHIRYQIFVLNRKI